MSKMCSKKASGYDQETPQSQTTDQLKCHFPILVYFGCHFLVIIATVRVKLIQDFFVFCYERDFMLSLSDNNQTDIIEAFNSTSRYLDD